jgi:hypothetical protein
MNFIKKAVKNLAFFLPSLLPGLSTAQIIPDSTVPPGYSLVWSDEFNQAIGGGVDAKVWNVMAGKNNANNELEIYTADPKNISIQSAPATSPPGEEQDLGVPDPNKKRSGVPEGTPKPFLAITATKENDGNFNSARINTQYNKSFQYGYIEARIQLPYGRGIWPAFWMLGANSRGWPGCGEIDIMENIGKYSDQGTCHGSLHGPGYSGEHCLTGHYVLPNQGRFKEGYHIFAVLWEKDSIQFYCDGQLYEKRTPGDLPAGNDGWVYNHPFYLILNLAVGGNWPGNPDASTSFPQKMKVDYVRVYQKLPSTPTPPAAGTTSR